MDNIYSFLKLFPPGIAGELSMISEQLWQTGEELRFRMAYPCVLISNGQEYTLSGCNLKKITKEMLNNIINRFLNYSEYAHLEELRSGYISLPGGHRAGFCGQTIIEQGNIKMIRNVSSINIRLAKSFNDMDESIFCELFTSERRFGNTLIVSPPGCGKTTLLRCLIRHLSQVGYRICVCDERFELSGAGPDGFSFDLGPRTDVLTGCSKEEGMILMLRSMGPQILAVDEIGSSKEVSILRRATVSGVNILATVHGSNLLDVIRGPLGTLIIDGTISRILFLSDQPKRGTIYGLWKKERVPI